MVKVSPESVRPESVGIEFDDERLIANAGLVLIATLGRRLGIEHLVDKTVRLGERAGASEPGRKVLTLIHAIVAGADSIEDTDVLRSGATEALLGHKAMAPSTLGTFPLLPRRGQRRPQAGRLPRLHRVARLPPAARHPGGYRRGPARPSAQGSGQLRARSPALLRRAPRTGAQSRGNRGDPDPRRLGLLLTQGDRLPAGQGLPLLDLGSPEQARRRADRRDPRVGLAARRRLPRDGRLRAGRDHLQRAQVDCPPRPPARPGGPGGALCLLVPLRLSHQQDRGHAHRRCRAPPPCRGRAGDPRPQGLRACPLPLRELLPPTPPGR